MRGPPTAEVRPTMRPEFHARAERDNTCLTDSVATTAEIPPQPNQSSNSAASGWLSTDEAARELGVTAGTLRKWRMRRRGPAYRQFTPGGPVKYDRAAIERYKRRFIITPGMNIDVPNWLRRDANAGAGE